MKLAVVPTRDVGVKTGRNFTENDYIDTCIDNRMRDKISPVYESSLPELTKKNTDIGNLAFMSTYEEVFKEANVIYIAIGTLRGEDVSENLKFVEEVVTTIALTAKKDTIVVTMSSVPGGTNDRLLEIIDHNKLYHITIGIVSNTKFSQASIEYGELRFLKVSEGFTQIVNKYGFKKIDAKVNVKNNHHSSVMGKLNVQLHASLESWCG